MALTAALTPPYSAATLRRLRALADGDVSLTTEILWSREPGSDSSALQVNAAASVRPGARRGQDGRPGELQSQESQAGAGGLPDVEAMDLLKSALAERQAKAQKVIHETGQKWIRRSEIVEKQKDQTKRSTSRASGGRRKRPRPTRRPSWRP
ncbi:unnamed protein product [Prorocentrum cordatum]|uniref:Uncharacterized protein n=1 Tax=Prorocentrum cordatum TaxID=2364126 RepID=A0ABN9SGH8_9DINO|nr:unnamed protein product [Polarella glacialis]